MRYAEEVDKIVTDQLDVMIRHTQKLLGVENGDLAAAHFSNKSLHNQIRIALMDYVIAELQSEIDTLEAEK